VAVDGFPERQPDDRRRRNRFVVRERRSGFDRRVRAGAGGLLALDTMLRRLRDRPSRLLTILIVGNALSVLDALLTFALLKQGFVEANPVLHGLMDGNPIGAALLKAALVASASVAIWLLRRYKVALEAAVFLVGIYGFIVVYEIVGLLLTR
jgi:hypothetical protein